MKILVLSYEFPPVGGGGGRVAEEVALALVARGHEVRVHSARLAGQPKSETHDGLTIHRTYGWRRSADRCSVAEMALYIVSSILPATRLAMAWRPDVVHAHFAIPTGPIATVIEFLTGIPYVITGHLGDVPGGVSSQTDGWFRWLGALARPVWSRAADVTGVSGHVCGLIEQAYLRTAHRIPNGIQLEAVDTPPRPAGRPRRLLFAGRFNPQKNVPFLIEVLAELRTRDWTADLFGDGADYAAVCAMLRSHGLENRVILHGWQAPAIVESHMRSADVLLLPSLSEGFPVVAAKAQGYGLAVLASDIDGVRELIDNGVNGILCPVNDRTAFVTALDRLLEDDTWLVTLKAGAKARAPEFALDRIVDRYEAVLSAASKAGRSP